MPLLANCAFAQPLAASCCLLQDYPARPPDPVSHPSLEFPFLLFAKEAGSDIRRVYGILVPPPLLDQGVQPPGLTCLTSNPSREVGERGGKSVPQASF